MVEIKTTKDDFSKAKPMYFGNYIFPIVHREIKFYPDKIKYEISDDGEFVMEATLEQKDE